MTPTRPIVARTPIRPAAAATTVVATLAMLAGCAASPPEPTPPPAPAVAPAVLTPPQSDLVFEKLSTVLGAADAKADPKLLAPRVEGPALRMRTAEYVRSTATGGAKDPTVIPSTTAAMVVPATTEWPRTQLFVTEQPADLQAQRIVVMRQDGPRAQFRMWGWARLLPGASMPVTAPAATGSEVLEPDDDSLVVPPGEVLAQFADVLAKGSGSSYAASFADDQFRTELEELRARAVAGVGSAGKASSTYTAGQDVSAWKTLDGGAIVVGELTIVSTMAITTAGATIPIADPFVKALAGVAAAAKSMAQTYTSIVALYVPPAGSTAKIKTLGAESVLTSVKVT